MEAILEKRPGRVLTRGAAAKIFAGQKDACFLVTRLIEWKGWIRLSALWHITPVGEQSVGKSCAFDGGQVFGRDDVVRVNMSAVQRNNQAVVDGKCLHDISFRHSSS